ncbi:MAG: lytic transglycosylase domain-containing protein [Pseudomonadales bacterium]|nr:lytic transglycosylase domain-containing protein [Pseudomonadales bacterium]
MTAMSAPASDIYKYRAADGTILFTDQPQDRVGSDHTLLSVRKGWSYTPRALTTKERDRYDTLITQAASEYGIEPALVKAVIHAESLFNPRAVSRVGAQGLMQLMPETASYLKVSNPFNASENIHGGTRFLAYLKGKFSSLDHILAAYNAGEGNVRRYGGIPPFKETQAYVRKVKQLKRRYAGHFVAGLGEEKVVAAR